MNLLKKSWAWVLLAALAVGPTHAQSPVPEGKQIKLTPPEMLARTESIQGQIQADMRHVLSLQKRARDAKDVIKLNCINDKMVQMKAQQNIFESAQITLKAAAEGGSTGDDTQGFFLSVTETGESIKKLRAEADICVGEPELFKQESSNEVKRPDILDDPAGDDPFTDDPFEPPGYASPYN